MSSAKLNNISKDASEWRDLNPEDQQNERRVQMGLIVGGIVLLIGTVLAVYFAATAPSTSSWCASCNATHVTSPAISAPIVGVIGGGGSIAMITIGAYSRTHNDRYAPINYEHAQPGHEEDLSKQATHAELILTLTKGKLKDVYDKYYKKNGGLGPLVRQGYMLPEQGNKLRELLATYHAQREVISSFRNQPLCKQAIDQGNAPKAYKTAKDKLKQAQAEWKQLRQEIENQYHS